MTPNAELLPDCPLCGSEILDWQLEDVHYAKHRTHSEHGCELIHADLTTAEWRKLFTRHTQMSEEGGIKELQREVQELREIVSALRSRGRKLR